MKSILIICFAFCAIMGFSQVKEGEILYDVYVTSDNPKAATWIDKMQNSSAELYFTEGKIRSNLYLGDVMTTSTLDNKANDTMLILMDGMMGKIAMKVSKTDTAYDKSKSAYTPKDAQLMSDTKEVMGYKCKKAIVTMEDSSQVTVWYTTDILPTYRSGQFLIAKIPGTPLEIESTWGKMANLKMVAYKFKAKIKDPETTFSLDVPKGYTEMTAEQMRQMRGGK